MKAKESDGYLDERIAQISDLDLDWNKWFQRWEAMQNSYIPERRHRFDLMLQLADLPKEREAFVLDLGCGPGSLAFWCIERQPNAHVIAVDADPVLLTIGQQAAKGITDRIQFVQADIRQADWWHGYEAGFDLVLSATVLHWLNAQHLAEVFRRIYRVLKSGGRFMNSDHIASDSPSTQARYRGTLRMIQKDLFRATGADNWDSFWNALGRELAPLDLRSLRNTREYWEGSDDGQPKQFHMDVLRQCGFEEIAVHWQDLGEAVIGAQKPSVP